MAASTRVRVVAVTLGCLLMTRETVWWETPASCATSVIAGARKAPPEGVGLGGAGATGRAHLRLAFCVVGGSGAGRDGGVDRRVGALGSGSAGIAPTSDQARGVLAPDGAGVVVETTSLGAAELASR